MEILKGNFSDQFIMIKTSFLGFLLEFTKIKEIPLAGQKIAPGNGVRLLAGVWCLCAVIFVYVYVGILVSVLIVPKLRPLIDSLEDLPASNLPYGTRKATSTEALLSVIQIFKKLLFILNGI
jgi:hypothetical protein